jgi:SAM-dependent methyltransferase
VTEAPTKKNQQPNMWDERYNSESFFYGTEPNDFLVEQSKYISPQSSVLCLAEGEGRNAVYLASLPVQPEVTALDSSSVGLEKAKKLAESKGVRLKTQCADLNETDLGEQLWDAVVSIWCHLPSSLRGKLHLKVIRALKPGGVLILEAYTPAQLSFGTGGPKDTDMLMTLDALKVELAGLDLVVAQEKERDIQEGQGHSGPSAVVQIVARRPFA